MAEKPMTESRFYKLLRELEAAETKKDTAVAAVRSSRKDMKGVGIDLAALDFCRKRLKALTEPEIVQFGNAIIQYAKYLKVPKIADLPLFAASAEKSEDELYRDAFEAGKVAKNLAHGIDANPYDLSTPMGQAWRRGYDEAEIDERPDLKVVAGAEAAA